MEKTNPIITVVVPVYGCKTLLLEQYLRLSSVLTKVSENYEIILVNDGNSDDSNFLYSFANYLPNSGCEA